MAAPSKWRWAFIAGATLILATFGGTRSAGAVVYWYYCDSAHTYYPYVSTCPEPWRPVVAQPEQPHHVVVPPAAPSPGGSPKPAKAAPVPLTPAPTSAAAQPTGEPAAAPTSGKQADAGEWIQIGEKGWDQARVVRKSGIGTTAAEIEVLMDLNREIRACSDQFPPNDGNAQDQASYQRCIDDAKSSFKGPSHMTARANCSTGEMWGFRPWPGDTLNESEWGPEPSRFYVGRIHHQVAGLSSGGYDDSVFNYQGFRVPTAAYTGVDVDGEVFRELCPNSYTDPPKSDLDELNLDFDCKEELPEAERIAVQAGLTHVMNVSIIKDWDAKSEGTTWYAARCSATILTNTGVQAKLEYEEVPVRGDYFIRTKLVP